MQNGEFLQVQVNPPLTKLEAEGNFDTAGSNLSAFITLWQHADPELQPKVPNAKEQLPATQSRKADTFRLAA